MFTEENFQDQILEKEKKVEEIKVRLERDANIERQDPLLKMIAEFNVIGNLDIEEIEFIQSHYNELKKKYEEVKDDNNIKWKYAFPGCGEKKIEPYGDFIIYHEILKFMKSTSQDAIFLTNDVEKNDWLLRNKAELLPYTHYIVNSYANTHHTLFIFHAKDKIRVSYNPVYQEEAEIDTIKEFDDKEEIPKLEGIKVLGRINLSNSSNSDFSTFSFQIYDDIGEDEFMNELRESEKWAAKYGEGFVGLKSFIIKYLGSKGYNYKSSFKTKDKLLDQGLIEIYTHIPKDPIFNPVEAIRIK